MEWFKTAKNVSQTKGTLIYGPYPITNPEGVYKVSFPETPERPQKWVKSFEELITVLKAELE
jgi:hypothetical protein